MNDQVMASTMPRAASSRRARRTRRWVSVSSARATPCRRGIGAEGTLSRPGDADHLLDQIGGPADVRSPARHRHLEVLSLAGKRKTQRLEGAADLLLVDDDAGQPLHELKREVDDALASGRGTRNQSSRRCAARHLQT